MRTLRRKINNELESVKEKKKLLRDAFGVHFPLLGVFQGYVTKTNLSRSGSNFLKIKYKAKEFKIKDFEHAEMSGLKGLLELSFEARFCFFSPEKRNQN